MERREFEEEIFGDVKEYAEKLLRDSVHGYTTVTSLGTQTRTGETDWDYVLVPVWVVTYRGRNGKMYYYAINGQTGNVCGELPIDHRKVGVTAAVISAAVFLLGLAGGFLL